MSIWQNRRTPFPCSAYEIVPDALKRMRVCVLLSPLEVGTACHTIASVLMSIQQNRWSSSP